jgi:hypothetical protein
MTKEIKPFGVEPFEIHPYRKQDLDRIGEYYNIKRKRTRFMLFFSIKESDEFFRKRIVSHIRGIK